MDAKTRAIVLKAQQNEITEHRVYSWLASRATGKNKKVLEQIAADELRHYEFWKKLTKQEVAANGIKAWWYITLSRIFGFIFALRLMERGEELTQQVYSRLSDVKGIKALKDDEHKHEEELLGILHEQKLEYAGSIVLGLNDALVELTGALAGLTFALQNGKIVALAGFITGFAASLSMAASEYLQSIEEAEQNEGKNPLIAAVYTGVAYIVVVLVLISPFVLIDNIYTALTLTLLFSVWIVASYTYYMSIAKGNPFWPRFLKMASISLGVAALSFGVGILLRSALGIEL